MSAAAANAQRSERIRRASQKTATGKEGGDRRVDHREDEHFRHTCHGVQRRRQHGGAEHRAVGIAGMRRMPDARGDGLMENVVLVGDVVPVHEVAAE